MTLRIITTGGTIDKVYFDHSSEFQVGEPQIDQVLRDLNVDLVYVVQPLMRIDSLEMVDTDRERIATAVRDAPERHIIITHGTDTMVETARYLGPVTQKTVVLTGSMQPARFRSTDAVFNIGMAIAAVQTLASGVYLAISGRVFDPNKVRKNRAAGRFEAVD